MADLASAVTDTDFERRFGGLRRLYGPTGAQRVFDAHVVVVGIGGVGSWAAEALARSGVGRLTLVDMDHVALSNVNRQIQAQDSTMGMAKIEAMRDRIHAVQPGCHVHMVDDFVTPDNWAQMAAEWSSPSGPLAVVDACDQVAAKTAMAHWAGQHGALLVLSGAAGGKRLGHRVEIGDLAETTHDPLLAQVRYRLRKHHGAPRDSRMGVTCVFSREPVAPPDPACAMAGGGDGSLNCHGYGSSVAVTATFGMAAAGWVMDRIAQGGGLVKKSSRRSKA